MTRISSAIKQGQRPTAALLEESDPNSGFTHMDYLLQDVYHTMDQERCSICKNPVWLCHSTDNRIDFKVVTRTCYAKAELEDFEKSEKGKKLDAGEYTIAVPIGVEPDPLPTRTEAYERMPRD